VGIFPSSTTYNAGFSGVPPHLKNHQLPLPKPAPPAMPRTTFEETFTYDATQQQQQGDETPSAEKCPPPPPVVMVSPPIINEGAINKKKKKSPIEIPVELLMLGVSGYLSTLNPAVASVITEQIDTSFFWNFNILDYAGMGFPRVSRSLKRGAVPYDPDTDPETQKREGLDQYVYIKKQQVKNANWDNLWEEFLRECQNSPGALLLPALLFTAIPLTSRFTGFPAGRRGFQVGGKEIDTNHIQPFVGYLNQLKTTNPAMPTIVEERQQLLSEYYQSLFKQENPALIESTLPAVSIAINKPVTLFPLFKGIKERPSESIYTLTPKQLTALAGQTLPALNSEGIDLSVGGIAFKVERHPSSDFAKANTFTLSTKAPVTVGQLSQAWADALANLTAFQLKHDGVAKATFPWGSNKQLHTEHQSLIQHYVLLTNILDAGIEVANKQLGASSHANPSQINLGHNITGGKPFKVNSFMHFANQADKIQDVIVAGFKKLDKAKATVEPTVENFVHALKQTQHNMGAMKFVVTIGSGIWMSWWMWTLAHILQAGRAYPANRLVRSESTQPPPSPVVQPRSSKKPLNPQPSAKAGEEASS
jgi:hypothetical protein